MTGCVRLVRVASPTCSSTSAVTVSGAPSGENSAGGATSGSRSMSTTPMGAGNRVRARPPANETCVIECASRSNGIGASAGSEESLSTIVCTPQRGPFSARLSSCLAERSVKPWG